MKFPKYFHCTLIDPEKFNRKQIEALKDIDTDYILVGGTSNLTPKNIIHTIREVKKVGKPIIQFPRDASEISDECDHILISCVITSRKRWFLWDNFVSMYYTAEKLGLDTIFSGYFVFPSNTSVSYVTDPVPFPSIDSIIEKNTIMLKRLGFDLIYLEGGSGGIPPSLHIVSKFRKCWDNTLILGGGVDNNKYVEEALKMGVNGIVNGTALEKSHIDFLKSVVNSIRRWLNEPNRICKSKKA